MTKKTGFSGKLILWIVIGLIILSIFVFCLIKSSSNYVEQGIIAENNEEYDQAIKDYNHALKLNPFNADAYLWRGRSHYYKEEYNLALADFTKAIKLQKDDYPSYTWRARTQHKMRNYDLAIADFSKSIELDESRHWDIYLERAKSYFSNKEYVLEIADYNLAISALDKEINSPYISDERMNELKEKRKEVIEEKRNEEKFIEWKKNNPEGSHIEFLIIEALEKRKKNDK